MKKEGKDGLEIRVRKKRNDERGMKKEWKIMRREWKIKRLKEEGEKR